MDSIEVDYLVVGGGASGLAFTDALLSAGQQPSTDGPEGRKRRLRVAIVDRRGAPGGHWNDAYAFVRLHMPAAYYGVNSLPLGDEQVEESGPEAGAYGSASGAEVQAYFQRVLKRMQASDQVRYLATSEYRHVDGQHRVQSLITGKECVVHARLGLVNARYYTNRVPATHERAFSVAPEVACIPINDLIREQRPRSRYVVIGAGKTGMDACLWLLEQGVDAERIRWIKPREPWLLDRKYTQPRRMLPIMLEGAAAQAEAVAGARDADEVITRLAAAGHLLRIDGSVTPTMYRCATVSETELQRLRQVRDVVRLGKVQHIDRELIRLEHGAIQAAPADLYIDCSATALTLKPPRPVFQRGEITLQPLRTCQPCFSAAITGYLEATRAELVEKNAFATPNILPSEPSDWLKMYVIANQNELQWSQAPDIRRWIRSARLHPAFGSDVVPRDDPRLVAARAHLQAYAGPAMQNAMRLLGAAT